jgi:heme/copper-type cytochrome/quinol oxidase subunit 3
MVYNFQHKHRNREIVVNAFNSWTNLTKAVAKERFSSKAFGFKVKDKYKEMKRNGKKKKKKKKKFPVFILVSFLFFFSFFFFFFFFFCFFFRPSDYTINALEQPKLGSNTASALSKMYDLSLSLLPTRISSIITHTSMLMSRKP